MRIANPFFQVPFARSSLNHDDVFILDTENKIYQFNGANSNIQERAKALEVVQYLKDTYHEGKCDVAIIGESSYLLSIPFSVNLFYHSIFTFLVVIHSFRGREASSRV